MNTFNFYKDAFKNYVNFEGRASKSQYWYFGMWNPIVSIVISIVLNIILHGNAVYVSWVYDLIIFLPAISISVRRLHDIGKSGWWNLIIFIPLIGVIVLVVFALMSSEPGTNKYGANPNEGGASPAPTPAPAVVVPAPAATTETPASAPAEASEVQAVAPVEAPALEVPVASTENVNG